MVAGNWCDSCSLTEPLLKVWDVASGRLVATLELPAGEPREVTFSGDGRIFLALTMMGQTGWPTPFRVMRWETATWTPIEGMTIPSKSIYATALAPGGDLLAATQLEDNPVILIEIPTGRERIRIAPRPPRPLNLIAPSYNLRFSPDGRTLVAGGPLGEVELLDVSTGTVRALIPRDKDRLGCSPRSPFRPTAGPWPWATRTCPPRERRSPRQGVLFIGRRGHAAADHRQPGNIRRRGDGPAAIGIQRRAVPPYSPDLLARRPDRRDRRRPARRRGGGIGEHGERGNSGSGA